jgi:hypothetical protein
VKYKYADNVGLKRMTKGFIYFRGSNSLSMITSIAADAIFVDELDRMETDNVPLFEKRLLNSDMKWKRWASTPTVSGFGIDKRWEESDQHYYYVKCNHCNEWQTLSFFENVEELSAPDGIDPDGLLVCRRCRKHIVPWLLEGKWEATKVSSVRGYFLNQLCSPQLDLKNMIKASKRTSQSEIQQFYNQDLGLTYEPKGASLTEADLKACIRGYKLGEREDDEFVGIDVGKFFHVIKLGRERLLDVQEFTDKDELINYLNGCNLKGMVIDALPETRISQEVVKAFEGRAHYSYYSGIKPTKVNEWWQIKDDKVVTDRTLSLDELYSRIKTQKMHLPNNIFEKKDFVAHYKSTTRVVTKEEGDKTRVDYKEVGPDHYLHASNYANMARDIFEQNGAEPFILVV